MPTPELLAAISLDGLIGPKFAELKGDVYLYGCISSGLALTAVAFLVPFDYIWNTINLGVLMGFNLCNLSLISVRAGNGGTCDNPRAQTLLTSFVVTVRAQRPGRARRWRAVEQFRDGVAPRRRRRLAIFSGRAPSRRPWTTRRRTASRSRGASPASPWDVV